MKGLLITAAKLLLTGAVLLAVFHQMHWQDRVTLQDGRECLVREVSPEGFQIVTESGAIWIGKTEIASHSLGFRSLIQNTRPTWTAAALSFQVLTTLLVAIRWAYLLRVSSPVSHVVVVEWLFKSRAAGVLPIGQLAPEVYRAHMGARAGNGYAISLAILLVERFIGLSAMAVMAAAGLFCLPHAGLADSKVLWVVLLGCMAGPWLVLYGAHPIGCRLCAGRFADWASRSSINWLERISRAMQASLSLRQAYPATILLSLMIHTSAVLDYVCIDRMLGLDSPAAAYFVTVPLVTLLLALPIHIAGIGVLEGGLVVILGVTAGMSSTEAIALAAAVRVVGLAWMPITLAFLWKRPSVRDDSQAPQARTEAPQLVPQVAQG